MIDAHHPQPGSDRQAVGIALVVLCVAAWAYLLYMGWGMAHMDVGVDMAIMPRMIAWQADDLALVLLMWTVMMAAMMLPSAAPMVLLFGAVGRQLSAPPGRLATSAFVGGYLAVWAAFSIAATVAQWGLLEARLVSPMMVASSDLLAGGLLIAAGAYQFASFRDACLARCRSPLAFLVAEWRSGTAGAWRMGLRHGLACVGCCWLVMLLLFVLGVMNLYWIGVLAAFVLLEKTLPDARWLTRAGGLVFIGWGIALLVAGTRAAG